MLNTLESILGVVQNLQTRMNQIENSVRPTAASEVPRHLQPRQVNPVHRQRLQSVLRNALPKRVQIQEPPSRASAAPLTSSEESMYQASSPQGRDHRPGGNVQRSEESDRVHYPSFPNRGQEGSEKTRDTYQRQQMDRSPHTMSTVTGHSRATMVILTVVTRRRTIRRRAQALMTSGIRTTDRITLKHLPATWRGLTKVN